MDEGLDPRPIETLAHVESLFAADPVSLAEWLDAVRVAKAHERWDLVERCAECALNKATGAQLQDSRIADAARALVAARLRSAGDLAKVLPTIGGLRERVGRYRVNPGVRYLHSLLNEVFLLLSDASAPSLVSACARLRKLEAPAQGRMAAMAAMAAMTQSDADRAKALTTACAAALDLDLIEDARRELEEAHELDPESPYVAAALARCSLLTEDYDEAAAWANQSIMRGNPRAGWTLMAVIARKVGDDAALKHALSMLEEVPQGDETSHWPLFVAGRLLAQSGDIDEARYFVVHLTEIGETRLADRLRDEIATARAKRQASKRTGDSETRASAERRLRR